MRESAKQLKQPEFIAVGTRRTPPSPTPMGGNLSEGDMSERVRCGSRSRSVPDCGVFCVAVVLSPVKGELVYEQLTNNEDNLNKI